MKTCANKVSPPSAMQQPLSCTWREWIARPGADQAVEAIVVGSGYGGSVAALRLAEKGYRVLLLERGSEYLPGDFPNDFSGVPKHFRLNIPGRGVPMGRASGLIEISVGQGMVAVTGNGLGGGSLINAGVLLRPDADVFSQDEWPAEIRHGFGHATGNSDLDRAFALSEQELGGEEFEPPAGDRRLCKTEALFRVAGTVKRDNPAHPFKTARLTINPDVCTSCGDCASGCNVPGAKLTLSTSYLAKALATGLVQIVTQAQVYRFEPCNRPGTGGAQWLVTVFSTDTQQQVLSAREAGTPRPAAAAQDPASTILQIPTTTLVISAGTLGSTQLLQRSQAMAGEAMAFSQSLGTRLSGNGDSLSITTGERLRVNAVGFGADVRLRDMDRHDPNSREHLVGPTITASLDFRDQRKPLDQRILLQDGAIPGAIARPFAELVATAYSVGQLGKWWFRDPQPCRTHGLDPLAASPAMTRHSQVLLAMGHDGSPGRMVWLPGLDTSAPVMDQAHQLRTYQEQQHLFDQLKPLGTHVHSPLWEAMPASMSRFFKGVKPPAIVTTVHPLGGCPMGDDPTTSVVNHLGQVWVYEPADPNRKGIQANQQFGDSPPNRPQVYPGLFVLDGSIVPTSLGCNPMLTITALAERAMASWPVSGWSARTRPPLKSAERPMASFARNPFPSDVKLCETLRASGAQLKGEWFEGRDREHLHLVLSAQLDACDFERTLVRHNHPMAIGEVTLELIKDSGAAPGTPQDPGAAAQVLASYTAMAGGRFEFLRANRFSSGRWLTLWCTLQLTAGAASLAVAVLAVVHAGVRAIGRECDVLAWTQTLSIPAVLGMVFAITLLPFPRTVLTWLVMRGWSDIAHREKSHLPGLQVAWRGIQFAHALLKQLMHAAETRNMRYDFKLKRSVPDSSAACSAFPDKLRFKGSKRVSYRASLVEWALWLGRHAHRWVWKALLWPAFPKQKLKEIAPLRPGLWEQVMNAHIQLSSVERLPSSQFAVGTMKMGLDNLFNRDSAQLGQRGDTTSGLLLLAGYPMLLARFAIKTRLFDFRLPNHSNRPVLDSADLPDVQIRQQNGQALRPELHWLQVQRGESSSDQGTERIEDLKLRLWRYRCSNHTPTVTQGEWQGVPVRRARSVLLLHAFGQSGLSFTHQAQGSKPGSNLAEAFHLAGYEVWILDSRMSTRSGHAAEPITVDMQARFDVPAAVDRILDLINADLKEPDPPPLQISAFGQCMGSAALWMALLEGRLSHGILPAHAGGQRTEPALSKLACVAFGQVHALVQASPETRAKTWLPGLLQAIAPRGVIPFGVRGAQDSLLLNALDRLLSTLPVPEAERTHSRNEDGVASCKRIRFIEAPLFQHENMHHSTVAQMNRLFGDSSIRLFAQARRFVERGRLVDEDGVNRYVTDINIRRHLSMPVQLLHGVKNELFDVQSAHDTHALLNQLDCTWMPQGCQRPQLSQRHGHLDVLLGTNARDDVFPDLLRFFDGAQGLDIAAAARRQRPSWVIRAPLSGPWLGRVDRVGNQARVRLVFLVDDLHGGHDSRANGPRVIVRQWQESTGVYHPLPVESALFVVPTAHRAASKDCKAYRTAWVDLPIELNPDTPPTLQFQVMTAHRVLRSADDAVIPLKPTAANWHIRRARASMVPSTLTPPPGQTPYLNNNEAIDEILCDNLAYHHLLMRRSRLTGMPVERPMEEWAAFSVPRISLESAGEGHKAPVRFLVGCCRHPGLDVDTRRIQWTVPDADLDTAFALLVGDQIYADATAGLLDPLSPTERYVERYESAFGHRGMGPLMARLPTYTSPDDHEWVDAQPNGAPLLKWSWASWQPGKPFRRQEKRIHTWAGRALTAFQNSLRWPLAYTAGRENARPGWTEHRHGCVNLIVIDSRSWRTRERGGSAMARVMQDVIFNDLLTHLHTSPSDVLQVIVTGSVVVPGLYPNADPANPGESDTWQFAPEQRRDLLDTLVKHCPRRFLLVSGDYHVSTAVTLKLDGATVGASIVAPPIYAPLPYANAAPEHVDTTEQTALPAGLLTQHLCAGSTTLRGNGMGEVTVRRQSGGAFEIRYQRTLTVLETGETVHRNCQITL